MEHMKRFATNDISTIGVICWIAVVVVALVFLLLAYNIGSKNEMEWDTSLMRLVQQSHTPMLDTLMRWITRTASIFAIGLAGVVAAWLWRVDYKPQALTFLVAMAGLEISSILLKRLFERARPDVFLPLTTTHGYSFPSGHTTSAAAFYGLLAVWLWRTQHRAWAVLAGLWVLMVGVSRVYLGAHYPSDVLAALALGVIWIFVVMRIYDRYQKRPARP
ncbi:MAG: phosphatase PAP2 family protein [Anaerolineae bacterium]|nr:MAG: phosphatase PAP2 family protein [Anaerolineae bacterium]